MSRVIVYIATSLDGYIARKDDDVSWLDAYQVAGEDYGYSDFMKTIGAAVMGPRTYDESLKHPERILVGMKTYVLSNKPMPIPPGAQVEFYNGDLRALVERIGQETSGDIYVVGGGQVVSSFLNAGLVDEIRQFIVPILLKEGIALYPALHQEIVLKLVETARYDTGIVKLQYVPEYSPKGR